MIEAKGVLGIIVKGELKREQVISLRVEISSRLNKMLEEYEHMRRSSGGFERGGGEKVL